MGKMAVDAIFKAQAAINCIANFVGLAGLALGPMTSAL
jgi:hypothetical protein